MAREWGSVQKGNCVTLLARRICFRTRLQPGGRMQNLNA